MKTDASEIFNGVTVEFTDSASRFYAFCKCSVIFSNFLRLPLTSRNKELTLSENWNAVVKNSLLSVLKPGYPVLTREVFYS